MQQKTAYPSLLWMSVARTLVRGHASQSLLLTICGTDFSPCSCLSIPIADHMWHGL